LTKLQTTWAHLAHEKVQEVSRCGLSQLLAVCEGIGRAHKIILRSENGIQEVSFMRRVLFDRRCSMQKLFASGGAPRPRAYA
jgi:hypothetical protein